MKKEDLVKGDIIFVSFGEEMEKARVKTINNNIVVCLVSYSIPKYITLDNQRWSFVRHKNFLGF